MTARMLKFKVWKEGRGFIFGNGWKKKFIVERGGLFSDVKFETLEDAIEYMHQVFEKVKHPPIGINTIETKTDYNHRTHHISNSYSRVNVSTQYGFSPDGEPYSRTTLRTNDIDILQRLYELNIAHPTKWDINRNTQFTGVQEVAHRYSVLPFDELLWDIRRAFCEGLKSYDGLEIVGLEECRAFDLWRNKK